MTLLVTSSKPELLKSQFRTAQASWGKDEAPQAPRSSAVGARIEAPKEVGVGRGVPLPTGERSGENF